MSGDSWETELNFECSKDHPDADVVRQLCRQHGVPSELRGKIWQILLGVCNKNANLEVWSDSDLDLEDQQVIKADVIRTRQSLPQFKTEEVQKDLETLLTVYCKRRSVKYTQGLNELLAPFFVLNLDRGEIFNCFYALIQRYAPNTLRGHDLKTLRRSLDLLGLLVAYHAPTLARHLQALHLRPDLYATKWVATMMASDSDMSLLLLLWDDVLIRDDALFLHFILAALLVEEAQDLVQALTNSAEEGTERLCRLRLRDADHVTRLLATAQALDAATPKSFRRKLYRATVHNEALEANLDLIIQESPCLPIAASDLASMWSGVAGAGGGGGGGAGLRFVVLDCRVEAAFLECTVPTALHLDASDAALIAGRVDALAPALAGQHVSLLLPGRSPVRDAAALLRAVAGELLARDTPHVSVLEDGFEGCVALHERGQLELVSLSLPTSPGGGGPSPAPPAQSSRPAAGAADQAGAAPAPAGGKGKGLGEVGLGAGVGLQHQEALKKAQAAAAAAADKTKEKAKVWGSKGMGMLTSAFSKARLVATDKDPKDKPHPAAPSATPSESKGGWADVSIFGSRAPRQEAAAAAAAEEAKFSIEEDEDADEFPPARRPSQLVSPTAADAAGPHPPAAVGGAKGAESEEGQGGRGGESGYAGLELESEVDVAHWMDKPNSYVLPCKRVGQNGKVFPRYLIVCDAPAVLMDVEAHKTKLNVGTIKACNGLVDLDKVTFSKKDPDLVTFIFRRPGGGKPWGLLYVMDKDTRPALLGAIKDTLERIPQGGAPASASAEPKSSGAAARPCEPDPGPTGQPRNDADSGVGESGGAASANADSDPVVHPGAHEVASNIDDSFAAETSDKSVSETQERAVDGARDTDTEKIAGAKVAEEQVDEKAREEAQEQAQHVEDKSRGNADDQTNGEPGETKQEAQESAKKELAEKAKKEADEKAKKEAEDKAKKEAEDKAKKEAEDKAKKEAEDKAKKEAEEKAKKEAEEKAKKEADEQAKKEAEEKAKKEAEEKAKKEAEDKAKKEAEDKAKKEAEDKAKKEADEQAKKEAEDKAKKEADEKAKKEAEEKAKKEAEEKAKKEADEKAKKEAEDKAKKEADEKAKKEAEDKAKKEANEKAKKEADEKAKKEAEEKAKVEGGEGGAKEGDDELDWLADVDAGAGGDADAAAGGAAEDDDVPDWLKE